MEGQHRVIPGHLGMHSVAQLVSQGSDVAHLAVVVDQHPGRQTRQRAGAERPTRFARSHLRIEVVVGEHPQRVIGQFRRKAVQGVQHHIRRLAEGVGLVRATQGGIDIISPQLVQAQPARLEAEPALEQAGVLAAHLQKGVGDRIGNIVAQVAHRNG